MTVTFLLVDMMRVRGVGCTVRSIVVHNNVKSIQCGFKKLLAKCNTLLAFFCMYAHFMG